MERLKEERLARKLTQTEMAEKLGISYSMYMKIEQGWRGCSDENKVKIAEFFGKSVGYLFFGEETTVRD